VRIASLNIQHGRTLSDGEVDADRLVSAPTFPANAPRVQLDHVLARRWHPTVTHTGARRAAGG